MFGAITGLPSQNSVRAATRAIGRLVPICTMASTSSPSTSFIASRGAASEVCAISTGLPHLSPFTRATAKPLSSKKRRACSSPAGM